MSLSHLAQRVNSNSLHVVTQPTAQSTQTSTLHAAALAYAARGFYVFPLRPNQKDPATTNGLHDATTDPAIIDAWWKSNPRYNIGINAGKSGLLVVDADLYKAPGDNGKLADLPTTVTVNTARGGKHLWYRMPQGKEYGNSSKGLPTWIDVRGHGGYVVAPPSIYEEDGAKLPYSFADGRGLGRIRVADLPKSIADVLEAAQTTTSTPLVIFSGNTTPTPDLTAYNLPDYALATIQRGAPKGLRSEADFAAVKSLVRSGLDANQIRAIFNRYPIGAKYKEKGKINGDKYLALTIGKVQAHLANDPATTTAAEMRALKDGRAFMTTATFTQWLKAEKVRYTDAFTKFLVTTIKLAENRRSLRITISNTRLGLATGLSPATAHKYLCKATRLGIFKKQVADNQTTIDVEPVKELREVVSQAGATTTTGYTGELCADYFSKDHYISELIVNSATKEQFLTYPKHLATRRRFAPTELIGSLGADGLRLWAELEVCGSGKVKQLAARLGWLESKVRKVLARFDAAGILFSYKNEGDRATTHELHPDHEARLEESLPMMTTYGIGKMRAARAHDAIAGFAQMRYENEPCLEPKERMRLHVRWERHTGLADANYSAALAMGVYPYKLKGNNHIVQ